MLDMQVLTFKTTLPERFSVCVSAGVGDVKRRNQCDNRPMSIPTCDIFFHSAAMTANASLQCRGIDDLAPIMETAMATHGQAQLMHDGIIQPDYLTPFPQQQQELHDTQQFAGFYNQAMINASMMPGGSSDDNGAMPIIYQGNRMGFCLEAEDNETWDSGDDLIDDDEDLEFEDDDNDCEHADDVPNDQSDTDNPERLLGFAQTVTKDIQSVFSRNKGADDYCDIYEERFKSTLSGREMYYRDLLALASNGDSESTGRSKRKRCRSPKTTKNGERDTAGSTWCANVLQTTERTEHTLVYDPKGEARIWKVPHEGRMIVEYGLGPLEELFGHTVGVGSWRLNEPTNSGYCTLEHMPMAKRKLPDSFWEEPGNDHKLAANAAAAPDFTDFFSSWVTM